MDEILKFILEILCYATGKFIAGILFPRIRIEQSAYGKKVSFKDSWGLTYKKKGLKYFHESTITLIGLLFWAVVIVLAILTYQNV